MSSGVGKIGKHNFRSPPGAANLRITSFAAIADAAFDAAAATRQAGFELHAFAAARTFRHERGPE